MKRVLSILASCVLFLGLGLIAPATAGAAPYCGITWGSLPTSEAGMSAAPITDLRAGRHACYDRLVVDLDGKADGYLVRYGAVERPGIGGRVALVGGADLEVIVLAPAYDSRGRATYSPTRPSTAVNVAGYSTFRQVAFVGSFEGQTTIGLGVRSRLPMRAFVLDGPGNGSRLVVDVAHRW
ncbi:hypothetical protein [Brachybacterium sp. YJGR34]|uniref:AMIN-like domain-containing (lipo)protein n=1 Tax=Brachybacterium sp. YJGR34 TaxID=2059911 RepID=UPI000E0C6D2D|nr:hypothetical protein [Brachybacterium sp. YJGR34]